MPIYLQQRKSVTLDWTTDTQNNGFTCKGELCSLCSLLRLCFFVGPTLRKNLFSEVKLKQLVSNLASHPPNFRQVLYLPLLVAKKHKKTKIRFAPKWAKTLKKNTHSLLSTLFRLLITLSNCLSPLLNTPPHSQSENRDLTWLNTNQ